MAERKYQSQYCEENIFHLCQEQQFKEDEGYVVFISSHKMVFGILHQKIANVGSCCFWDYHVIYLNFGESGPTIWDLDTRLPLPSTFIDYITYSLLEVPKYRYIPPTFFVVEKNEFVSRFDSDRSHMLKKDRAGNIIEPLEYLAPPPSWPICTPNSGSEPLPLQYIFNSFKQNKNVMNVEQLLTFVNKKT